jgi:hypothetical protein
VAGFGTADLLCVAEAFATDYSSAVFEAAVAGVPCYFYAPDLPEYVRARGFYLDYPDDLPGPLAATPDELMDAIAAQAAPPDAAAAFAREWVATTGLDTPVTHHGGEGGAADRCAAIVLECLDRASARPRRRGPPDTRR